MSEDAATFTGSVCAGCGLCCDGTLFDYVAVDADELDAARAAGLVIDDDPSPRFIQPCAQLCGGLCSVYAARPRICRTFACKLSRKVDADLVMPDEARGRIVKARELAAQVRAVLPPGTTIVEANRAWRDDPDGWRSAPPEERRQRAELHLRVTALNLFLDTHFRSKSHRRVFMSGGD